MCRDRRNRSLVIEITPPARPPLTVGVHRTIREIAREHWDACFADDPEAWAYYAAVEDAGLAAFSWMYFAASEGDRVLAVVPAFVTAYALDTTIQGRLRSALAPLLAHARRLLTLQLVCLGSPLADKCHLGFSPQLPRERRGEVTASLLATLDSVAAARAIGLVAAKDVDDADLAEGVGEAFAAAGFSRQPGLPDTVLNLRVGGEESYLESLSRATRRDLRRKLKAGDGVRIEQRFGAEAIGLVPAITRLYDLQRSRSSVDFDQFETLTAEYFRNVLAAGDLSAVVFLYWHRDQLAAFNLCYHTDRVFIDKFIGFDPAMGRALNLYALSWMTNVRYCFARGIGLLKAGQTGYAMKRRMGCELLPHWICFRHRNPLLNRVLRLAGPLLAADRHDPDLAQRLEKSHPKRNR